MTGHLKSLLFLIPSLLGGTPIVNWATSEFVGTKVAQPKTLVIISFTLYVQGFEDGTLLYDYWGSVTLDNGLKPLYPESGFPYAPVLPPYHIDATSQKSLWQGFIDFPMYAEFYPEGIKELNATVVVTDVNPATMETYSTSPYTFKVVVDPPMDAPEPQLKWIVWVLLLMWVSGRYGLLRRSVKPFHRRWV